MTEPDKTLNKGIVHQNIDVHNTSDLDIGRIKKGLLRPLIKDEAILEIMSTEENFSKIKHKLDYNLIVTGKHVNPIFQE